MFHQILRMCEFTGETLQAMGQLEYGPGNRVSVGRLSPGDDSKALEEGQLTVGGGQDQEGGKQDQQRTVHQSIAKIAQHGDSPSPLTRNRLQALCRASKSPAGIGGAFRIRGLELEDYSRTRTTTRRFCERPSDVELSDTGFVSPNEIVFMA